jgi:hypothetical protein
MAHIELDRLLNCTADELSALVKQMASFTDTAAALKRRMPRSWSVNSSSLVRMVVGVGVYRVHRFTDDVEVIARVSARSDRREALGAQLFLMLVQRIDVVCRLHVFVLMRRTVSDLLLSDQKTQPVRRCSAYWSRIGRPK